MARWPSSHWMLGMNTNLTHLPKGLGRGSRTWRKDVCPSSSAFWHNSTLSLCYNGLKLLSGQKLSPLLQLLLLGSHKQLELLGATLASITLCSQIVHLFEGLYSWAFKPPSLPWYMVDSDPREGQYSIMDWNILLCANTRPKEALVLSLGSFHIRRNCHLPACGLGKGLFSISRNVCFSGSSACRRHT